MVVVVVVAIVVVAVVVFTVRSFVRFLLGCRSVGRQTTGGPQAYANWQTFTVVQIGNEKAARSPSARRKEVGRSVALVFGATLDGSSRRTTASSSRHTFVGAATTRHHHHHHH